MARQKKLQKRIKVSTKLEVVERLSQTSSRKLAKEYGVSRSNVLRWKSQEPELRILSCNACRLPGGGAKIIGEELHAALTEKVLYERSIQRRVTRCMIRGWATNMRPNMDIDVVICPSWVDRLMSRAGFVLRKSTRKPVLEDRDIIERGVLFVREICDVIAKFSIQPSMTFNLDETAVFFAHSKHTTVHHKGAKDVPVQSFGSEKQRVTAVFCASANSEKKLPCVMIKKTPVPDEPPVAVNSDIIELRMGTSWMNVVSFIEYLGYLFPDPVVPNTILLIFDSVRCHTAKDVKEYLAFRGILYVTIPGGMTEFCQPADFGWFAQLKIKLSKSIDKWKHAGPHQFARGGCVKPPAPAIVAAWLADAWEIVQQSTVKVSFTRCALGSGAQLHLSRHERLGESFLQKLGSQGGEQIQVDSLQDILDEFDELLVVDELW